MVTKSHVTLHGALTTVYRTLLRKPAISKWTTDELVQMVATLDTAAASMRGLKSDIAAELHRRHGGGDIESTDGGAVAHVSSNPKHTWDDAKIVGKLRELTDDPAGAIIKCAKITYWRVSDLKDFGVDADSVRKTDYNPSVTGRLA